MLKGLAIFGTAMAAVAALGGIFNPSRGDTRAWYDQLEKPAFTPPDWVFGPVWTTLYVLIAISGARVWRADDSRERTIALRLWAAQLAFNGAWSPLFFGAKKPGLALADITLMLLTIAAYIAVSRKSDKAAAWLFAPYLAWVALATAINAEVVRLND